MPEIGLFEAIYSARSIRRLKPDPVPEELITKILDAAIRAPSGGNCSELGLYRRARPRICGAGSASIYRKASDIAEAVYAARGRPPHLTEQQFARMMAAGSHLWDHMGEAPVLLIPARIAPSCRAREALPPASPPDWEDEVAYAERIRGASIYPAVQNILLACRGLGLGTVITTNHIRCEGEVKALLGIPEDVSTWALMPVGWPIDKFGPLTRRPLAEVAHADRWGSRLARRMTGGSVSKTWMPRIKSGQRVLRIGSAATSQMHLRRLNTAVEDRRTDSCHQLRPSGRRDRPMQMIASPTEDRSGGRKSALVPFRVTICGIDELACHCAGASPMSLRSSIRAGRSRSR